MRIEEKFKELRSTQRKAFIAYIPFGYPKIKYTKDIILTLQEAGVDLIELGMPFSDPLADGPIIQKATHLALKEGATLKKLFNTLEDIRSRLKIPVVIMTYYNPLFKFGSNKFFKKMKQLDISGIIVVDLPFEESRQYIEEAKRYDLETVFFITPTTNIERAKRIGKLSKGFIYYVSVTGITGPKHLKLTPLASHIKTLRRFIRLPICVGFGIHRREQIKEIDKFSDGVIVGSGIVKFIEEHFRNKNFLVELKQYVNCLCMK